MKRTSRIVAFAAVFTLIGIALPAGPAAAADRRGDAGTPQQCVSNVNQSGPMDAQAKNQANYHADYHAKGSQEAPAPDASGVKADEPRDELQLERERRNPPNTDRFGRPTFPR